MTSEGDALEEGTGLPAGELVRPESDVVGGPERHRREGKPIQGLEWLLEQMSGQWWQIGTHLIGARVGLAPANHDRPRVWSHHLLNVADGRSPRLAELGHGVDAPGEYEIL